MALAVAEEMKKIYKKELEPEPIPLTVPGEPVTEDDVRFFYSFYLAWFELGLFVVTLFSTRN